MGTVSCSNWKTKKDVVNELTNDLTRSGFNVLGQKGSVDGVWYLVEKEARKFIYFGKIEKNRGQFFLKDIPEDMGPCYYSCPVKFIHKADEPVNEYSREWREKVLAYHAQASKKVELSEGMKLKLYDNNYTMTKIYKLGKGTNYIVTNEVGQRFRLKRTQLKDIEVLGE